MHYIEINIAKNKIDCGIIDNELKKDQNKYNYKQ